jgi:hypothetical protein
MGEIHEARDAEQNGPAERNAGVAGTEHDAIDDLLRDVHVGGSAMVPR